MKAAILRSPGIDGIRIEDVADPEPGPGEVLVRLRAASLNFRDLVVLDGGYGAAQRKDGLILLSDGAGEIVALGAGVEEFQVGDRVTTCFFQDWVAGLPTAARLSSALSAHLDGIACELRSLPVRGVMPAPDHLSWIEAATLPCAALTAWSAVMAEAHTRSGEVVVTQGTGGVSLFAMQFAQMAGAQVIATSSSEAKLARLAALGCGTSINYRTTPAWGKRVRELTRETGADLVVDIGGADTLKQSMLAVRTGGTIALIGVVSGTRAELNLGPVVTSYMRLIGITVGSRDRYGEMLRAVALHKMRPVVDRTFALADIKQALFHLRSGEHVGKVCIEI